MTDSSDSMNPRRFPPPWSVEDPDACYIIREANGQALGLRVESQNVGRHDAVSHRSRFGPRAELRGLVCRRGRGGSPYRRLVLQGRLFHCLGNGLLRASRGPIFVRGERDQDG